MLPNWFMWLVFICNAAGAVGFMGQRNWWFAWVWFCYAASVPGFIYGVK